MNKDAQMQHYVYCGSEVEEERNEGAKNASRGSNKAVQGETG